MSKPVLNPDVINKDKTLFNLGWYLGWNPQDDTATLDGKFTAEELIAIANHMMEYGE